MLHVTLDDGSRMLFESSEAVFYYPKDYRTSEGGNPMLNTKCDMARMLTRGDWLEYPRGTFRQVVRKISVPDLICVADMT